MDLSDIPTSSYPDEIMNNKLITEEEVRQVLARILSSKVSGKSGITSNYFKLIEDSLVKIIICLI